MGEEYRMETAFDRLAKAVARFRLWRMEDVESAAASQPLLERRASASQPSFVSFDDLTRTFATGLPRRQMLKLLASGLASGTLMLKGKRAGAQAVAQATVDLCTNNDVTGSCATLHMYVD